MQIYDPASLRRVKVTQQELTFPYSYGGKVKTKILPYHEINVINFKHLEQYFLGDQLNQVSSKTEMIIAKMNTARTTPDLPKLETTDCVLVRHFDRSMQNFTNYIICTNDKNNSFILEKGLKNAIYSYFSKLHRME
jgi:hypothetical protein